VTSTVPLVADETLGEIEKCFASVLSEHGGIMKLRALYDACVDRGMNANSFYQYMTYSPIVCRLSREVYALVGAEVLPGTFEDISRSGSREAALIDHGWTEAGDVWISYRLNASNLRTGVFTRGLVV
jgi:hypothetical protein